MLTIVSGQLAASKTHTERRWTFCNGVVTIVQGRRDCDSYGVEVDGSQVLFAKLDAEADVYGVQLTPAGRPVHCTCRGFAKARRCKRIDTAREMIADGLIPVVVRRDSADLDAF